MLFLLLFPFFRAFRKKADRALTLRLPAVDDCTLAISTSELAELHRAVNLLGKLLTNVNLDGLGDEGRKGKRKSESRFVKTPFKLYITQRSTALRADFSTDACASVGCRFGKRPAVYGVYNETEEYRGHILCTDYSSFS